MFPNVSLTYVEGYFIYYKDVFNWNLSGVEFDADSNFIHLEHIDQVLLEDIM